MASWEFEANTEVVRLTHDGEDVFRITGYLVQTICRIILLVSIAATIVILSWLF